MKRLLSLLLLTAMVGTVVSASASEIVDQIITMRTTSAFSEEAVDDTALGKIVEAGLAAASARNLQPWHFAVITNKDVMDQISGMGSGGQPNAGMRPDGQRPEGAPPQAEGERSAPAQSASNGAQPMRAARAALGSSPVAIIIYTNTEYMQADFYGGNTALFDCGLATQNMIIAANALGYGAKVVAGPLDTLNGSQHDTLCDVLSVDPNMSAVAVLLIGVPIETATDAVSSASVRSDVDDKVSYSK